MNPQKYNEHTALNHSILWRKSYTFEKPLTHQSNQCHKQLNPLAQTGVSWRTRNNMIQTNFSGVKSNTTSFRNTKSMSRVNDLLKDNKSESPETRSLKQSLTANSNVLQKSLKLVQGMEKLKDMKLLENKDLQRVKYPGIIRHAHVYNDYHERVTNPGFSRNVAGKHFTK